MTRFILIVVLLVAQKNFARYRLVETTPVPVERVLTNLTARLNNDTNNFELLHVLARLHSLSYARAASNWLVDIPTNSSRATGSLGPMHPFFGYGDPGFPPQTVTPVTAGSNQISAQKHLAEAIHFYKRSVAINPTNPIPRIGLGWCLMHAGEKNAAKRTLREAVKLAWAQEKKGGGAASPTAEAIHYLRLLLDRKTDKQELDSLRRIAEEAHKVQRWMTPLVLPLQPNLTASDLINTNASVAFDLDGSGVPNRKWQWINTNAAWIVHLPQGGSVTSALQMFGNVTFWMFWENGYHALASLDDNADGLLSGPELHGIHLWQDRNSDGQSTSDEILNLHTLGVTALDTGYNIENQIPTSLTGAHFSDGSTRATYDLLLKSR